MRKICYFFFSSRRRHTSSYGDWSSDVCSSDLRSKPFFTLAEDWTWIQNATKEKASENYGARLLLDNWPTRLLREAEMLESRVIPAHSQLRQGQGYKADFRGYSIKIEKSPEGGNRKR